MEGIESTLNSTTTPLGLTETWAGTFEHVQHFAGVALLVTSDVISVENGVQLIWSNDGVSEDAIRYYTYQSPSGLVPDEGLLISSQVEAVWLKVRFVKSPVESQTEFSLKTLIRYAPASPPMRRLRDTLYAEDLAVPTISWIAATKNLENANNSTDLPLILNDVFEGAPENVTDWASITVSVYADEAGVLSVEFSQDNVDWEDVETFTILADTAYSLTFRPRAKWFRVVYTNGGVNQTVFKLQTIYRQAPLPLMPSGALVERGDTIATGGVAQTVSAANAKRRYFLFENVSDTEMWLRLDGGTAAAAQPSLRLVPLQSYESGSVCPTGAISVFCATTGKGFAAYEG